MELLRDQGPGRAAAGVPQRSQDQRLHQQGPAAEPDRRVHRSAEPRGSGPCVLPQHPAEGTALLGHRERRRAKDAGPPPAASPGLAARHPADQGPAPRRSVTRHPADQGPAPRRSLARRPADQGPAPRRSVTRHPADQGPAPRRSLARRPADQGPAPSRSDPAPRRSLARHPPTRAGTPSIPGLAPRRAGACIQQVRDPAPAEQGRHPADPWPGTPPALGPALWSAFGSGIRRPRPGTPPAPARHPAGLRPGTLSVPRTERMPGPDSGTAPGPGPGTAPHSRLKHYVRLMAQVQRLVPGRAPGPGSQAHSARFPGRAPRPASGPRRTVRPTGR